MDARQERGLPVAATYTQDWPTYNEAQTREQEHFVAIVRDLCNGIPQPEYSFGRPRLSLADVVFGLVYKSYTMMSGRRFMTNLRESEAKELVAKSASFASNARYLGNPELSKVLVP